METRMGQPRAIARGQGGQFAAAQAREVGFNDRALRWLRETGEVTLVRPGVSRFTVTAGNPDPAVTAYLLCWPHAVICRGSAAQRHGLKRIACPQEPEVLLPLNRHRRPAGIRVHVTRNLPSCDVLDVNGVRYTSLARTVCDLADPGDLWQSLAVLDEAVGLGASRKWIHQRASALAPGRPALIALRDATGPDGEAVFRSWLERASAYVWCVVAVTIARALRAAGAAVDLDRIPAEIAVPDRPYLPARGSGRPRRRPDGADRRHNGTEPHHPRRRPAPMEPTAAITAQNPITPAGAPPRWSRPPP